MSYNVMCSAVRFGTAPTWEAAREALADHMETEFRSWSCIGADQRAILATKVAAIREASEPAPGRLYEVGDQWHGISAHAGIGPGDLAILHDYGNGHRDWTIDVKCKVLAGAEPGQVRIQVTGDSLQLARWEIRKVPASFIRRR